jgi:hypothetical protein
MEQLFRISGLLQDFFEGGGTNTGRSVECEPVPE